MAAERAVTFAASVNHEETAPLLTEPLRKTGRGDGPTPSLGRRKSSTAKLAIERMFRTRERVWSSAVSSLIAAIPALLVGFTIGFPSPVLTELTADSVDQKYKFDYLMSDLFAVSNIYYILGMVNT